ncbi:hypothetical protein Lalb_Chr06g0168141 [Lupinus albus]|uniref:Uncharacterized protein n=1 Tax=Lupinus albus TaxID=3870 RepID=A0A6A4QD97_LUPAL|nr:hypothetical protein Lalb_Chr06g0168141 [Lupinus albus]
MCSSHLSCKTFQVMILFRLDSLDWQVSDIFCLPDINVNYIMTDTTSIISIVQ